MRQRRNKGRAGPEDMTDVDISFPLKRLFDTFNLDHVKEKKRMELFEHRDLAHIKHYKAAVKIFGGPLSRKRVMIAPPMETPMKHRLGLYMNQKPEPAAPILNTPLKPQPPAVKPEPEELVLAREAREREDTYKQWFRDRQKFRNDLENMGLNSDYLENKPNKTALEKRVLRKLREEENKAVEEESFDETPEPISREYSPDSECSNLPKLQVPAPLGLRILEKHLKEKKMRLVDLFTDVDKNKDWKINRAEFIKACKEKDIPISHGLLEDMLITLDINLDDELDYKELAQGMELARREAREDKRKELSRETTNASQKSVSVTSQSNSNNKMGPDDTASRRTTPLGVVRESPKPSDTISESVGRTVSPPKSRRTSLKSPDKSEAGRNRSLASSPSKGTQKSELTMKSEALSAKLCRSEGSGSPNQLEPPPPDVRLEQMILPTDEEMLDLRKRDREGLKGYNAKLEAAPGTILTGSKAIDNHCTRSTLVGDVGEMVDKFRQKRLHEYYNIVHLCKERDIMLSKHLLEKVLLYPPDLPHTEIKKLRHPDSAPLVSSHFADKPKRPRTPIEVKHKDKVRRSKSGKLLIDSRHKYPINKLVNDQGYKENLSTGRAVIRRRIDCWMTFEEYDILTKHLSIRYQHLHGGTKTNAFWPGHLLDKLRLCMPPYNETANRDKENAIYRRVHRTPAVNYGYEPTDVWQTNDRMYTQIGIHDHFRNKTII